MIKIRITYHDANTISYDIIAFYLTLRFMIISIIVSFYFYKDMTLILNGSTVIVYINMMILVNNSHVRCNKMHISLSTIEFVI